MKRYSHIRLSRAPAASCTSVKSNTRWRWLRLPESRGRQARLRAAACAAACGTLGCCKGGRRGEASEAVETGGGLMSLPWSARHAGAGRIGGRCCCAVTVHVGVEEGKGEVWEGGWVSQQTDLKKRKVGFQNPAAPAIGKWAGRGGGGGGGVGGGGGGFKETLEE